MCEGGAEGDGLGSGAMAGHHAEVESPVEECADGIHEHGECPFPVVNGDDDGQGEVKRNGGHGGRFWQKGAGEQRVELDRIQTQSV